MLSVVHIVYMQDSGQIQRGDIPEDCFVVYQGWWMQQDEKLAGALEQGRPSPKFLYVWFYVL